MSYIRKYKASIMKKIQTTYKLVENQKWSVYLTESNEVSNHYSVHDCGEPCGGIVRHWATKEALIRELEAIVRGLKSIK